jgi:hypothetical protein
LCGVLLLTSRTAGLSTIWFRKRKAEFPPHPPFRFSFAQTERKRKFFLRVYHFYSCHCPTLPMRGQQGTPKNVATILKIWYHNIESIAYHFYTIKLVKLWQQK